MFPHGKDYLILRERRVTSGLTQQQVADKAGVKLQQYQKFESGERNLRTASFQIACKVLEALDLDIVKFFHEQYAYIQYQLWTTQPENLPEKRRAHNHRWDNIGGRFEKYEIEGDFGAYRVMKREIPTLFCYFDYDRISSEWTMGLEELFPTVLRVWEITGLNGSALPCSRRSIGSCIA